MKEIQNATRGNVYILTNTSNTFQINQQQQAWGIDKYANAYSYSAPRTFVLLIALDYKRARHIFVFSLFAINVLIFERFYKAKNVINGVRRGITKSKSQNINK